MQTELKQKKDKKSRNSPDLISIQHLGTVIIQVQLRGTVWYVPYNNTDLVVVNGEYSVHLGVQPLPYSL